MNKLVYSAFLCYMTLLLALWLYHTPDDETMEKRRCQELAAKIERQQFAADQLQRRLEELGKRNDRLTDVISAMNQRIEIEQEALRRKLQTPGK